MRNLISLLTLSVCLIVSASARVLAGCTLTFEHSSPDTTTGSCVGSTINTKTLTKKSYWALYMQNGGGVDPAYSVIGYETSGTGECRTGVLNQAACWPDFFTPAAPFYPPGTGTAVFEQRVKSYQVFADNGGYWNCQTIEDNYWEKVLSCPPHQPPCPSYIQAKCIMLGEGYDEWNCTCYPESPIVIDINGDGFNLTDLSGGVYFDLRAIGNVQHLSWTSAGSDDAWLVLDRNHNGIIDSGREMFGNFTPQKEPPPGEEMNGFLALAEYDARDNGGNADGKIDSSDSVFGSLRLWQDINHNAISEPNELHTFAELGLKSVDLNYKESKSTDQYGNQFRYRVRVKDTTASNRVQWAWDVLLLHE